MAEEIKPIGWTPDGSHVHKGALALVVIVLIGLYCIVADAPFGNDKTSAEVTPKVVVVK